jgi:hypothetical protein
VYVLLRNLGCPAKTEMQKTSAACWIAEGKSIDFGHMYQTRHTWEA